MKASRRNLYTISFSQFGCASANNFIKIISPFYIFQISPHGTEVTLLWIGAIMGSTSLFAALTSTFWGSLTHRYSPKLLYLRTFLVNTVSFLLMGFTANLYLLLLFRIVQGLVSGASTIGLIIVSSSSEKESVSADISFFQSSMTLGQLVGPLLGSLAAGVLGYKGAFVGTSCMLFVFFIFCWTSVADVPKLPKKEKTSPGGLLNKQTIVAWMVCFAVMIQLTFLPSVLPNVFDSLGIERSVALKLSGVVVMLYTATAILGTYLLSLLSRKYSVYRMILFLSVAGIIFQTLLAFSWGTVDFTVIRSIQTGLVAVIFPFVISFFAGESKGEMIGFLNSARFAGNAVGPILATSVLAVSNLPVLYCVVSLISLVSLLAFRSVFHPKSVL